MPIDSAFLGADNYDPAETIEYRGVTLPLRFGRLANEYQQAREAAAMFDRSDRGLVLATGKDRKAWLHNLVTNDVKKLEDWDGCYAFAIDVRGRVQFDLNILSLPDALWLDIDRAAVPAALAHLNKFLITEDVQLTDVSDQFARLGVAGPRAADVAAWAGVDDLLELAPLATAQLADEATGLMRHDFAGLPGFELLIPLAAAHDRWDKFRGGAELLPAGLQVLDVLRIEAGIPWLGRDIDDKVIPPETGQIERGISYHKGCYLGQEVIERMRSHAAVAKKLVKVAVDDGNELLPPLSASTAPSPSLPLKQGAAEVGRLTSLVQHPTESKWVGLGYLRTSVTDVSGVTVGEPPRGVRVSV
jgi:aminomethyltransferase